MSPEIVALHLGALHPFEKALTLLLAFGPFVALGVVVAVRRRQDLAEESRQGGQGEELSERATPDRPGSPS